MDSANVLHQMAKYDFSSPMDVTIIFEDSDDDLSHQDMNKENMKGDNTIKDVSVQRSESECLKENKNAECEINLKSLNKSLLSLNENYIQKQKYLDLNREKADNNLNSDKNLGENQNDAGQNHRLNNTNDTQCNVHSNIDEEPICNSEAVLNKRQMNDPQPVNTFIEDLLNKVSEHLVLIMQSFYHYGAKRTTNVDNNQNREKIFHFIRSHFFELSYNTVESIILPQEQNDNFINHFLNKTIQIANDKCCNWKCHRGHVQPFFKDLIKWTKQKKDHIKKLQLQPSNDNIILKQHLSAPPQPFKLPPTQTKSVPSSNVASPNIQNNLCIFSSGAPGSEISINIDATTLRNFTERPNTGQWNGNNNYNSYASNSEFALSNTSAAPPYYENQNYDVQNNNTIYNRPPPPPYNQQHGNQISKNFTQLPQQNHMKSKHIRQNYHNKEQISPTSNRTNHKNYQSIASPMQSYQCQAHYINNNQASPIDNSLNPRLHDGINAPTHGQELEKQLNSRPVITNVTSYGPKTCMPVIRCYMCGKNTSATTALTNHLSRPIFCSYLCQELESQFYKPVWGNT